MTSENMEVEGLAERVSDVMIEDPDGEEVLVFEDDQIHAPALDLRWAIVGRFITDRHIQLDPMSQVMAAVWRPGKGVSITEPIPALFLFQFGHEADVRRVTEGGPWSFENQVLVFDRINPGEDPESYELNLLPIWVQVHNLPMGLRAERVLQGIGNRMGQFLETDTNNFLGSWKSYARMRVAVDVSKALRDRMKISMGKGAYAEVVFRYERLPTFCYICGIIGHGERFCTEKLKVEDGVLQPRFGPELRALSRRAQGMTIGEKWLRKTPRLIGEGVAELGTGRGKGGPESQGVDKDNCVIHGSEGADKERVGDIGRNMGAEVNQPLRQYPLESCFLKEGGTIENEVAGSDDELLLTEVKRKRTGLGDGPVRQGIEDMEGSSGPTIIGPKNWISAGSVEQTRRTQ